MWSELCRAAYGERAEEAVWQMVDATMVSRHYDGTVVNRKRERGKIAGILSEREIVKCAWQFQKACVFLL